jgi:ankyrin repeat protein
MLNAVRTALIFCAVALSAPFDSPLFLAIRNDDVSRIKDELRNGTEAKAVGYHGTTPLMYAAAFGTVEAMRLLIGAGADVNAKNDFDATALMWGAADVAKGANVSAKSKQGRTTFDHRASHNGAEPIARLLVANGADPKTTDAATNTALIAAAQANDVRLIEFLLDKGVDVKLRNSSGESALMSAAGNGNLSAVQRLLKAGAEVNAQSAVPGFNVKAGPLAFGKYTALLLAAPYGSPELIETESRSSSVTPRTGRCPTGKEPCRGNGGRLGGEVRQSVCDEPVQRYGGEKGCGWQDRPIPRRKSLDRRTEYGAGEEPWLITSPIRLLRF